MGDSLLLRELYESHLRRESNPTNPGPRYGTLQRLAGSSAGGGPLSVLAAAWLREGSSGRSSGRRRSAASPLSGVKDGSGGTARSQTTLAPRERRGDVANETRAKASFAPPARLEGGAFWSPRRLPRHLRGLQVRGLPGPPGLLRGRRLPGHSARPAGAAPLPPHPLRRGGGLRRTLIEPSRRGISASLATGSPDRTAACSAAPWQMSGKRCKECSRPLICPTREPGSRRWQSFRLASAPLCERFLRPGGRTAHRRGSTLYTARTIATHHHQHQLDLGFDVSREATTSRCEVPMVSARTARFALL